MPAADTNEPEPTFDVLLEWSGDQYQRPPTDAVTPADSDQGQVAPAPTALLPALAARIDDLIAAVRGLGARVDGIAAATQRSQASSLEHFVEYVETTSAAIAAQNEALDEYRRASGRTVAELRRTAAETDALVRNLAGRLDELTTMSAIPSSTPASAPAEVDATEVAAAVSAVIADTVKDAIGTIGVPGSADGQMAEELAAIREELTQLKRRIGVRVKSGMNSEDQMSALADAIVERVVQSLEVVPDAAEVKETPPPSKRRSPPRAGRSRA